MKHFSAIIIAVLGIVLCACGGNSDKVEEKKDTLPENNRFIGETENDVNEADILIFKSLTDAVASIALDEDVIGIWSHEVGGSPKIYYLIYRANGMNWLRPVYVEGKNFRLADEKLSVQLKRINAVEFSDMQNGGGYRLTDSTLVVYDAQNYAEELGRRVFDWKD